MDEEQAALGEQRARWIDSINQGNTAGFVDVLTEDVVWLPSRHDAIQGKGNIRAWLKEPFAAFDYDYTISEIRLRVAGDWAIEQAKFLTKVRTKSGEALPPHEGLYTLIWRKTSAKIWLIERYIDHSATFVDID